MELYSGKVLYTIEPKLTLTETKLQKLIMLIAIPRSNIQKISCRKTVKEIERESKRYPRKKSLKTKESSNEIIEE